VATSEVGACNGAASEPGIVVVLAIFEANESPFALAAATSY
jgi:hypothetical protein